MSNVYVAEYITSEDRDRAYEFINMLLAALPIKNGEKTSVIDNKAVKLTYHRTKLKKEADFCVDIEGCLYTCKFIHSKLNHLEESVTNALTAFILSNQDDIERFIMD